MLCLLLSALLLAVSASAAATEISTADELLEIMNDSTKWGTSYILTADIDLSTATNGLPQKPIGSNSSHKYTATFDGANYKITGIDIENTSTNYTGLFGYVSGTIKNLNIYGKVVSTGTYTGGLIGVATGTCRVDNVECHIDVTGSTNTTSTSNLGTGGFIGALTPAAGKNAQISNVTYYGKVIAGKFVGGILGYLQTESGTASSFSISNAVNKGTVTATGGACAGGIVGYIIHSNASANRFFIDTCENQGKIHGINYVGGIVGAFGNAGGSTKTPFTFSKLSNRGLVKASTGIAAGIVSLSRSGVANSVIYTDCVNYGEIDAPYGAAGIISVTTTSVYAFSLIRCYNAGQYTGTTTNASYPSLPIESKDTSAHVTNVYYSGTENAAETHGAFVSDPTNKALFENFDFQDVWAMGITGPEIRAFHTHNTSVPVAISKTEHRLDCTCGEVGTIEVHDFTDSVTCKVCGYDPTCLHTSTHQEVTTASTCVTPGVRSTICEECGEVVATEPIAVDPNNHEDTAFVWSYDATAGKYYLTCSACSSAYGHQTESPVVYVNGAIGENANSGLNAEKPVATLTNAISHIANCGGTVVITSYTLSANETLPSWNGLVTFTASDFDPLGAATTGITIAKQNALLTMGGDAKFDAILMRGTSTSLNCIYIAANWHNLDLGYIRVQNHAMAYIFAGPYSISGTDLTEKNVSINLDMPALSTDSNEYFYERIYLGSVVASASANIENKNVSLTVNKGYVNSSSSKRTLSGTIGTIYSISTTSNTSYNAAVVRGCTANIQIGGDVVVTNLRSGDGNSARNPAAVSMDSLNVTLNDNATVYSFSPKNVVNGTVTISSVGRTVKQSRIIQFVKVGDFASESAALTLNYSTHSFAPELNSYYTATGYTVTDNGVDVCTWDTDVKNATTTLYTCTVCGREKTSDSFVYDADAFARPYTQNKTTKDIMSYLLRIIVRAYVPEDKTVEYYGIAMLPQNTEWTFEDGKNYVVKNEGSIETGATFLTDIENIPTSDIATNIFTWAFVKYTDSENVVTVPIGTYNVQDYMYTVEG